MGAGSRAEGTPGVKIRRRKVPGDLGGVFYSGVVMEGGFNSWMVTCLDNVTKQGLEVWTLGADRPVWSAL